MVVRLRIGGLTLRAAAAGRLPSLELPAALGPFRAARGDDIRLEVLEAPVPVPRASDLVFDSGGSWRAYRKGRGLLYTFRPPRGDGPPARGLVIDAGRRRGRVYLAPSRYRRWPGFALDYPLDELVFQHRLACSGGLVLHACGIGQRGKALLFCGVSGAGKTTLAELWRSLRPHDSILSDDRIILRRRGSGFWAWGTPWHGSGRFASPGGRPLAALFFLRKAPRSRVRPLTSSAAAALLFARSFAPPWDRRAVATALRTSAQVLKRVPAFELGFRPDASAIAAVEGTLAGRSR